MDGIWYSQAKQKGTTDSDKLMHSYRKFWDKIFVGSCSLADVGRFTLKLQAAALRLWSCVYRKKRNILPEIEPELFPPNGSAISNPLLLKYSWRQVNDSCAEFFVTNMDYEDSVGMY